MNCFPAASGNYLVNLDPDSPELEIVGWSMRDGPGLLPLVVGRLGPLVAGDGILDEGGEVFDLVTGEFFATIEAWRLHMSDSDSYRMGTTGLEVLSYGAPARAVVTMSAPKPLPTSSKPAGTVTGERPDVEFLGKVYAKQSFWQAPAENPSVVFVLEPGTRAPTSGALKITREDFHLARLTIPEATTAALMGNEAPATQPEEPAASEPEDDDTADMI